MTFSQNTNGYIQIMTQEAAVIWSPHPTSYAVKRGKALKTGAIVSSVIFSPY